MHLRVNKKNKIIFYFFLFVLFTTINNQSFYDIKNKVFKIDTIEIYGLRDQHKIQIIEKLSYLLEKNILFLDRLIPILPPKFWEKFKNSKLWTFLLFSL